MGVSLTEDRHGTAALKITPAAVAANTTAEQTFALPGLKITDAVLVIKPTHQAGVMPVHARASAANQIAITFANTTSGSLTPTANETYYVHWFRAETITASVAG